jgi:hypothetical protein
VVEEGLLLVNIRLLALDGIVQVGIPLDLQVRRQKPAADRVDT